MAMTRSTIRGLVEDATGRTDKTALINSAIDIAVEEVSTQHLWTDLLTEDSVTLLTPAPSVSLASDVSRVLEMRIIDGTLSRPLRIRSKAWIVKHFPNPSAQNTAKPVYGYLEGKSLFTVPIPNVNYTIRYSYYKLHPALTSDSSEVLIRHIGPSVAAYATFWVFQSIEKHEEAEKWLVSYLRLLASAKKIDRGNAATTLMFDQRGEVIVSGDYWLDPFVKGMP